MTTPPDAETPAPQAAPGAPPSIQPIPGPRPSGIADERAMLTALLRFLGTGVPIVTIASALSYVLGRIYVTSYYEEFGIPFSALNFTTSDFLFASVDIVFASLVAAGLVWVGYRQGVYILDSTTRLIPQLGVISAVSLAVGVLFAFFFFPSLPHLTGLTGLALGTLVGSFSCI